MTKQTERENYQWRPNDNSVTTRLRYDLEAEHWTRAFKSAQLNSKTLSFGDSVSVIGTILKLVIGIVVLAVMLVIDLIKWINSKY